MPPARRDIVQVETVPRFKERRACTGCRAIKSRCMVYPGQATCSRCLRLALECTFPDHHRGVKDGKLKVKVKGGGGSGGGLTIGQNQALQGENNNTNPFSIQSLLATDANKESTLLSSTAYASLQKVPATHELNSHHHHHNNNNNNINQATYVALSIGSVVAAKIVNEREARELIDFFYQRLNPIVALLDRVIYTPDKLLKRAEYRLLLASTCTVSSKFCMPQHYQRFLTFLEPSLASIAAGDTPPQLESVHSLSLLAMWKHPKDGVSWRKLRLAVTLAFELGLHNTFRQNGSSNSSTLSREQIQAQRSLLQLACFEDGYKDQCRMPMSIDASLLPEPLKWIESLGDAAQDIDIRLAASRENALVKQNLMKQLADNDGSSKSACLSRVRLINTAIAAEESNTRVWKNPAVIGLSCHHSGRPCLFFHTSNTLFNYHRALYSVYCMPALASFIEQRQASFIRCCELSIELFELFSGGYGENHYYRFVHDIVILNLAVAAVWISDNWQLMPVALARQAISAVCTAARITASSQDRKLEQASYLARFLAFCTTKFSEFMKSEEESNKAASSVAYSDVDQLTPGRQHQFSHHQQQQQQHHQQQQQHDHHARSTSWTYDGNSSNGTSTHNANANANTNNNIADSLSPDPIYMQSEAARYLEEILSTPCMGLGGEPIDTNSILSFFQESTLK